MEEYRQNNQLLIMTIIVLVILNIGSLALLWQNNSLPFMDKQTPKEQSQQENGEDFLKQELNLSARQVATFHQLREEHFEKMERVTRRERNAMEDFFEEMTSPDGSETKAKELASEVGAIKAEKEMELYQHFQWLKSVCNDSQKERLSEIFYDFMREKAQKGKSSPQRGKDK